MFTTGKRFAASGGSSAHLPPACELFRNARQPLSEVAGSESLPARLKGGGAFRRVSGGDAARGGEGRSAGGMKKHRRGRGREKRTPKQQGDTGHPRTVLK